MKIDKTKYKVIRIEVISRYPCPFVIQFEKQERERERIAEFYDEIEGNL